VSTVHAVAGEHPTTATCYDGDGSTGATLLLAHGAGAGQQHKFMVGISEALAARGMDVVTFDFPYVHAGRKTPDRAPVLEAAFEQLLSWTTERSHARGLPSVFIGGKSMGGRMATHLGARGVAGISGVVALGYPLRAPGRTGNERAAHLPSITAPLLIVQGTRDSFGSPDDIGQALAGTHAAPAIVAVEGGDHSFAVRGRTPADVFSEVATAVVQWCRAAVRDRTPRLKTEEGTRPSPSSPTP
jgi:predicted alpha/beta-hydrolase family hydrolase